MPEYLPLGAFRQGLLPDDCRSCAWWQTTGTAVYRGAAAADKRHEWADGTGARLGPRRPAGARVCRPARRGGLWRGRPYPPPSTSPPHRHSPGSASFPSRPCPRPPPCCSVFTSSEGAPRWPAKRLIRKALYELRNRGVQEVYAVAHRPEGSGEPDDCRFFSAELLAVNGFAEVAHNGHLCLMRVDNRGLVSLVGQVETAVRRVFAKEPAPSPAAWVQGGTGAEQGAP